MHTQRWAFRGLVTALTLGLATACSDAPTEPFAGRREAAPSLLPGPADAIESVQVLERTAPLAIDETVTRTIGPLGGMITLPAAGLVMVVPPGALSRPTAITATAPAGGLVGYHFSPAGLTFEAPVRLVQDLLATTASPAEGPLGFQLVTAYFHGPLAPTVEALELLPLDLLGRLGVFTIAHFSGYVIGTS